MSSFSFQFCSQLNLQPSIALSLAPPLAQVLAPQREEKEEEEGLRQPSTGL